MDSLWPALPLTQWQDTKDTLQLYTQIVGKIRMVLTPPEPQWAHVTFYVTSRGLTTSPIPYHGDTFQITFDLIAHQLSIDRSNGQSRSFALEPVSVAAFYDRIMSSLGDLDITVSVPLLPQEVENTTPFDRDTAHASYDRAFVTRFWRILSVFDTLLKRHRAPYRGRHTPVHFFWGGLDLAYTRYTGNTTQPPAGANYLYRTSMDAEEIYAGFWPGDARFPEAGLACYVYPRPDGIDHQAVQPATAFWHGKMGEFILRYDDVRKADSPESAAIDFLSSTFDACAKLSGWPLERLL
jgi:hypothetical protein